VLFCSLKCAKGSSFFLHRGVSLRRRRTLPGCPVYEAVAAAPISQFVPCQPTPNGEPQTNKPTIQQTNYPQRVRFACSLARCYGATIG